MSHYTGLPEVVVKPGNMISYWSSKLKICVFLLAVFLYIYCLLLIKTIYMKNKRLDHVMAMVMETEKLISNVHHIDQNLARNIERVEDFYNDY
ncbi:unnamed protein product [Diatraea saccharalis]|uniref:Uncharacterized protein n=1 Tax=Diatraea saccharalis TaxID=40085 RepID=A0A9N9QZ03_9NEOP|nr:unnamed protein product [Diatraea saccharalis]